MGDMKEKRALGKILKERHKRFRTLLGGDGTDCFRVYDRDLEGWPLTIDLYRRHALVCEYETASDRVWRGREDRNYGDLLEYIAGQLYIDPADLHYRFRPKKRGREQYEKLEEKGELVEVSENGLTFLVNLNDYIDTGLFMDHRKTRAMVQEGALGMRILNLFAYTGSFTVAAAAGGALETVTVDLSSSYLDWARKNMHANALMGDQHRFITSDVREFLMNAEREKNRFDLVIMDPPLFSNSRKTEGTFDLQRDYVWFAAAALKLLSEEGRLLFCTTRKEFHFDPGRIMGAESMEITADTLPPDFTRKKPHRCWLVWRKTVKVPRKKA
jgi:23S rRNA G2069 N7-methylase RlmK/C1962 C5-methylase RlmI